VPRTLNFERPDAGIESHLPRSDDRFSMAALSERDRKESNNELRTILLSHLTWEEGRDC
jgi:hypothetical protein